jgi:hypothetical protein
MSEEQMTVRLSPLDAKFTKMKCEYYEHSQQKGFNGYVSPWVPITIENVGKIKKDALCVNNMGMEMPFEGKRDLVRMENGVPLAQKELTCHPFMIKFVFVDPRKEDISNYLTDPATTRAHSEYSELMSTFLRRVQETSAIEPVKFPLFHGTNMQSALSIKMNGICAFDSTDNPYFPYGFAFYTVPKPEETYQVGNKQGAIVRFKAADKRSAPLWLDLLKTGTSELGSFLQGLHSNMSEDLPKYSWQMCCKELFLDGKPVSALKYGTVFVFEHSEGFIADRIINPVPKTA